MEYNRRQFLGSLSAVVLAGGLERKPPRTLQDTDDPLGVRADFPVTDEGIYLNSPYIAPSPRQVVDAGNAFAAAKGRNPIGLGAMLEETNRVRGLFARLIGATTPEIGILDATSAGENLVARSFDLGDGDNVVIDDLHYETTYVLYRDLAERRGIELRIVRSEDGAATPAEFAELVDDNTRLVSVAWVSHRNGYCHDLEALAELAHRHGAYLYADAIQGIGMLELDVRETGVDFLTSGTYKWLLGGFGVAPFYVREDLLDAVEPDRKGSLNIARELDDFRYELYTDGRKYLYATPAFGAVYQLGAALDYLLEVGVAEIEHHTVALAQRLHGRLEEQGHRLLTPAGNRSAIITFEHQGDPAAVGESLRAAGIQATVREGGAQIRVGAALFNNAREVDGLLEVTAGWR